MCDLEEGLSSFNSVEEELEYWKRKSLEYCERSKMFILVFNVVFYYIECVLVLIETCTCI